MLALQGAVLPKDGPGELLEGRDIGWGDCDVFDGVKMHHTVMRDGKYSYNENQGV